MLLRGSSGCCCCDQDRGGEETGGEAGCCHHTASSPSASLSLQVAGGESGVASPQPSPGLPRSVSQPPVLSILSHTVRRLARNNNIMNHKQPWALELHHHNTHRNHISSTVQYSEFNRSVSMIQYHYHSHS